MGNAEYMGTRRFAKESNKETENIAKDIIKHVKDLNNQSKDKFEETLNKMKKEIEENMNGIVTREKESHKALEKRSSANEKEISDKSVKNFNNMISGLNARLSQHEQMLNTHVAVCAEKYKSKGYGKVTYQELLTESVRIGGVRKRGEVLEPSQGEFIVPVGGEGTYQVSFSAIIDTHKDFDNRLFPAAFVFAKKRVGTSSWTSRPARRLLSSRRGRARRAATASPSVPTLFDPLHQPLGTNSQTLSPYS